jgi:hypothetical protein
MSFGLQKFVSQCTLVLPISNGRVSPQIYGVDIFRTSELRDFCLSLTFASIFFDIMKSEVIPSYPFCTFSRFDGQKNVSFPSKQILRPTPQVLNSLSLSMSKYHADYGFILPLLLLSFVTWPSNPLALRNILRFEIGSFEHHFHSKPCVQRPLI